MRIKIVAPTQTFDRILGLIREHATVHVVNTRRNIISCEALQGEILSRVVALGATVSQEESFDLEQPLPTVSFTYNGVCYSAPRAPFVGIGLVQLPDGRILRVVDGWLESDPPKPRALKELIIPVAQPT